MVLRDFETGAYSTIESGSPVWRDGCTLSVSISAHGLIDFAGFGWNGIYEFTCLTEADAIAITDR